jgi:16S rRNA (uracil1498-N3)-methyltransferase
MHQTKKDLATFFVNDINENHIILDENDSKHAIKVLRLKKGDVIDIINGSGIRAKGEIIENHPKKTTVQLFDKIYFPKSTTLSLAFCPTKNNDRNDWIIEKATEIGATDFYLIYSQNSERRKINLERIKKITVSALKQSGNLWLPKIHGLMNYKEFINNNLSIQNKFIAHCKDSKKNELTTLVKSSEPQLLVIGPEGDFTSEEINLAEEKGFKMVSIGENRLRTETACITGVSLLKLI